MGRDEFNRIRARPSDENRRTMQTETAGHVNEARRELCVDQSSRHSET